MDPPPRPFSFIAERLCLEFANTVDWHATAHPGERVQTVEDLLRWGEQAGIIHALERQTFQADAQAQPEKAAAALSRARELRESIYQVFHAVTHGHAPPAPDLHILTAARAEAAQQQALQVTTTGIQWTWSAAEDLNRVWWTVAVDAADLLTSELLARVGECADDRGCGWLFLDTSKAGRRRWCSMQDCGNRAKAQRHRRALLQRVIP
ncbi:CGNR zinc finger domain-containing protein [Deinococcus ruber]|uniref:Zinc finger CGNR domain-containing protein n=1 Tax=Deinococcus ruber TaxID=1848197 RepID=A0A918CKI2_9DEIO|nr:ABATE domain-containing protein [Deinococcus ruber]GGR26480.1 hypothetical protein GCM10008957_42540 [Deinococcus ruber]